jgi:hypothetical protein
MSALTVCEHFSGRELARTTGPPRATGTVGFVAAAAGAFGVARPHRLVVAWRACPNNTRAGLALVTPPKNTHTHTHTHTVPAFLSLFLQSIPPLLPVLWIAFSTFYPPLRQRWSDRFLYFILLPSKHGPLTHRRLLAGAGCCSNPRPFLFPLFPGRLPHPPVNSLSRPWRCLDLSCLGRLGCLIWILTPLHRAPSGVAPPTWRCIALWFFPWVPPYPSPHCCRPLGS